MFFKRYKEIIYLYTFTPKNITKDLILSITKSTNTLTEKKRTKPRESLEIALTNAKDIFLFIVPLSLEMDARCLIELTKKSKVLILLFKK